MIRIKIILIKKECTMMTWDTFGDEVTRNNFSAGVTRDIFSVSVTQ